MDLLLFTKLFFFLNLICLNQMTLKVNLALVDFFYLNILEVTFKILHVVFIRLFLFNWLNIYLKVNFTVYGF